MPLVVLVQSRPEAHPLLMRFTVFRAHYAARAAPWSALDERGRLWASEGRLLDGPRDLGPSGVRRFHEAFLHEAHLGSVTPAASA